MKYLILIAAMGMSASLLAQVGRYQIVSSDKENGLMVDTQTGRVWKRGCAVHFRTGSCSAYAWFGPELAIGIASHKEIQDYVKEHKESTKQAEKSVPEQ